MKLNIIIDGNYLLYKDVFILKNIRRINQDLEELLINDFKKISKIYAFDNIYFVSDHKSYSWRKSIYEAYKGNRTKDDSVDWQFVYGVYENFKNKIKSRKNVKFLEYPGLEGDDLIAHAVQESNNLGYSNIIISSDADIQQLLYFDISKQFINLQWNYKFNDERIYLPKNYQLFLKSFDSSIADIFNPNEDHLIIEYLEKMIENTTVKVVDREDIIFCKLLTGDKGDNIDTCILSRAGKLDEEGRGIGKDGAKIIYNTYKEIYPDSIDIHSNVFIETLTDVILHNKKIKDEAAKTIVENKLKFNRKLIVLDPIYMPENVYESMKNHYYQVENHLIEYEDVDFEYFDKKKDKVEVIPEQFNMVEPGDETFNIDDFWSL
jgi:5'-3' exonuclease